MSLENHGLDGVSEALAVDDRERVHLAANLFDQTAPYFHDRSDYPDGHPEPVRWLEEGYEVLESLMKLTYRATIRIGREEFRLFGPDKPVWTGQPASEVAARLSSQRLGFISFRPGTSFLEFYRLFDALQRGYADARSAPDLALDLEFEHIDIATVDESALVLAGSPFEPVDSDDDREKRAIQKLFNRSFSPTPEAEPSEATALDTVAGSNRSNERATPSGLDDETRQHIARLGQHFHEPKHLEFRHVELLVDLLVDSDNSSTVKRASEHLAADIGALIDNDRYGEARRALQIIAKRGDELDPSIGARLDDALDGCLTDPRMRRMVELVAYADGEIRKEILRFLHELKSRQATRAVAELLKWRLAPAVQSHLFKFLKRRSDAEFDMLDDIVTKVTTDNARRLVEAATEAMPAARRFLFTLLERRLDPSVKAIALRGLRGHLGPRDLEQDVAPLLESADGELLIAAVETLAENRPDRLPELLHPVIRDRLEEFDSPTRRSVVHYYADCGGADAAEVLKSLIRVKKLSDDTRKQLSLDVIQSAIGSSNRAVIDMIESIADDWMVATDIREACAEAIASTP